MKPCAQSHSQWVGELCSEPQGQAQRCHEDGCWRRNPGGDKDEPLKGRPLSLPVSRLGIPDGEMAAPGEVLERQGLLSGGVTGPGGEACGELGAGF